MENKITVSYFKCDTQKGNELFQMVRDMLETMEVCGHKVEMILQKNNPFIATESYLCDDIIIFDGSLEDEEETMENNVGQQYDAMIEPMKAAPHVLFVSRSPVPFNVMCVWKGGYPKYIRTGVSEYEEILRNEEILTWLRDTLIKNGERLLNSNKLDHKYYRELSEKEKSEVLLAKIKGTDAEIKKDFEEEAQVFVSYLSRYSRYFGDKEKENCRYTVEDLIEYISRTQDIPLEQIGYFPPGSLSRELMTLQRRWEIVSITDDFIRNCRQFWILAAPGYARSWWTLSERITLSYLLAEEPEKCPDIYVAKYDPQSCSFRVEEYLNIEAKKGFLPKLNDTMVEELARYFVNSRPDMIGYENVWIMELMNRLPKFAVRFLTRQTYKKMKEFMPAFVDEVGKTLEEYEQAAVQSIKSDVYTKSFWEDWIMECPYCKAQNSNNRYSRETFLSPGKSDFCQVVKKQDFSYDSSKDRYTAACKVCGQRFYFNKGFLYRWYPIRGEGVHTGPGGKSIERKIAFYFVDEEKD